MRGAASLRFAPERIRESVRNKSVYQGNQKGLRHASLRCQIDDTLILHKSNSSGSVHSEYFRGDLVSVNDFSAFNCTLALSASSESLSGISSQSYQNVPPPDHQFLTC